jgi:hypothetical protein
LLWSVGRAVFHGAPVICTGRARLRKVTLFVTNLTN